MADQGTHADRTPHYARGMQSSLVGVGVNLALAAGKLAAGFMGSSHALIADGVESLGDSVGSLIVLGGLGIASRPPDRDHPYGHGKAEPIAAALVAFLLIGAGIGIALESMRGIASPHPPPAPFTLAVVLGVVLIKEVLFRFVVRVGAETGSHAVYTDAWHHRSDAITSLAAAIGISVAIFGGPRYAAADDWAALFASAIIIVNGYRMLRPAVGQLMDQHPSEELTDEVTRVSESIPGVHRVEKLLMRRMGLYFVADMHIEVPSEMTVRTSHGLAHDVKEAVQRRFPQIVEVTIHVEPAGESPP